MDMGIIGPILVIVFIFILYYGSGWLTTKDKERHVDQEMRLREADLQERELELKSQIVDFERARLGDRERVIPLGRNMVDADYEELEYISEEDEDEPE